jgi:uridine kinase
MPVLFLESHPAVRANQREKLQMNNLSRQDVLNRLAQRITCLSLGRPVRLAVDGRTASGKTTLSDELATHIFEHGRPVIRTSIDGFHRPKIERYARGRYSAEGYYFDARDLPAIVNLLLAPLGPRGNGLYRTASFDLDTDMPVEQEPQIAPKDAILIVDGTFLQRPELREHWDATIFVRTTAKIAESRGLARDMERLGGEEAVRDLYAKCYYPAYVLYEQLCHPDQVSDAIIDNDNLAYPRLEIRRGGRL